MASRPRAASKTVENDQAPRAGDSTKLLDTLRTGSYRTQLEALRDELVIALAGSPAGAKAQTAAQLRAVLKDLASLPDAKKVSKADELADRRAARLAAAGTSAPAVGEGGK